MARNSNVTAPVCKGPIDSLSDTDLEMFLDHWCSQISEFPQNESILDEYYNTISPRSTFTKSLPDRALVLDMGAGDGALSVYKEWPEIQRHDLRLYGISLDTIERSDKYADVSILNFETTPDIFGGLKFDAILASHFIEHLSDPALFIKWAAGSLKSGGRVYLEWPHEFAKRMPKSSFFQTRGIETYTTNFFDDSTHVQTWDSDLISEIGMQYGLSVELVGRIVFPHVAAQLRDVARNKRDKVKGTFSVWCAVGWAQYVILTKTL